MFDLFSKVFPEHEFRWVNKVGVCPFHSDKKPSLHIYLDQTGKQKWHCFADGFGGSEADLVQRGFGFNSKAEANKWLLMNGYSAETEEDLAILELNWVTEEFYKFTNDILCKDTLAGPLRTYLATRGVETKYLPELAIGCYPTQDMITQFMLLHNIPESYEKELKVLTAKGGKRKDKVNEHVGSLIFFYRESYDLWGRLKIRNVINEKQGSKLIFQLGTSRSKKVQMFSAFKSVPLDDKAICVEGEFDVLTLISLCKKKEATSAEGIFCFGSGQSMKEGVHLLHGLGVEDIYVFPDNDDPGIKYAQEVAEEYPKTYVIAPTDYGKGEDPSSWGMRSTYEELETIFKNRKSAFIWLGEHQAKQFNPESPEDQAQARLEIIKTAKKLTPTTREEYLKSFAHLTGVSYDALRDEVAQVADQAYRKTLGKEGFGIHKRENRQNGKAPEWEHISNIIIEFEKDVIVDLGDGASIKNDSSVIDAGRVDRSFILKVISENKQMKLKLSAGDYADDRRFYEILLKEIGPSVWIKPRSVAYVKEAAVLLQPNVDGPPREVIYSHTGWRDGKYLMPNGYIDKDGFHKEGELRVELPTNPAYLRNYYLMPPVSEEIQKEALQSIREDLLKVFPYHITLPLLAHVFLAPLIGLLDQSWPYAMWIKGTTGHFKSTYTNMMMSFFGHFTGTTGSTESWQTTGNAIEKGGYYVKDCLYTIDDYKKVSVTDKMVTTVMQNYGDRHGRGRLRADTSHQQTWYIRGLMISTGEDSPTGEASVVARTLMLPITAKGDSDRLTSARRFQKVYPSIMSSYIQYLINLYPDIDQDELMPKLTSYAKEYNTSHNRVNMNLALNRFAWEIASKFLGMEDLTPTYLQSLNKIAEVMGDMTKAETAAELYIEALESLLSSEQCYLETCGNTDSGGRIGGLGRATCIGFVDEEYVYLLGNPALAEVNKMRTQICGQPLKYSNRAIYDQLIEEDILVPKDGICTFTKRLGDRTRRVIRLRKGALGLDEEADDNLQFTKNELRYAEERTDAKKEKA